MKQFTVFVDTDTIISSLLSTTGASYYLFFTEDFKGVQYVISNISLLELKRTADELFISEKKVSNFIKRITVINLDTSDIKNYYDYVRDLGDTHIVTGAKQARAQFLLTFNLKDYKIGLMEKELSLFVRTPGQLLAYLRSLR